MVVAFTSLSWGCSKDTHCPYSAAVAACQANNTAQVAFRNARTVTLDVFPGRRATRRTIANQTSPFNTVAAGVQHRLRVPA